MDKFLTFTIGGLATAAVYAVSASGLVVTYTTSGIFNFAHGAFSMMAAFTFWQVHVAWGVPLLPAVVIVVFLIAPLFGALIERVIMRGIEGTSDVVKVVVTIALMIALIGLSTVIWDPNIGRPVPPFFGGGTFEVLGVIVTYQRLLMLSVAAVVAATLAFVFKRTRVGVAMRAVVDDRSLMMLNGGRPGRVSMMSWALGAGMAAIAGVLLASEQTLSATTLTLLFINAYAVAVVGRLRSLPGVFVGAVILGLAQSYVIGYLPQDTMVGPISLRSVAQALPPLMLFAVMIIQPQDRLKAVGSTRAATPSRPPTQRFALVGGVVFVVVVAALGSLIQGADLNLLLTGFFYAIVVLSLVPLTGYAGQISLAQLSFTGIGAIAMATWGANGELWAVAASIALCAVIGALVAFPALRLSGIYLALGTAAFALFTSVMVFNQATFMPGANRQVPRLTLGPFRVDTDYQQLLLFAVTFAVIGNLIIVLRRSAWGRRLTAMKDSPIACATLGLNLTTTKVGVFALSAAIAGAAGAIAGRTFLADSLALPGSLSITMIGVVGGIGAVSGAFFGGLLLGAFPIFASLFAANAIGVYAFFSVSVSDILKFAPGFIGISLGRDPDGAAPQIAKAFEAVKMSPRTMALAGVGGAVMWYLAWTETITGWTLVAGIVVFYFTVLPLVPLLLAPRELIGGRRGATAAWMVTTMVLVLGIPWSTAIESNGMRVLAILAYAIVNARITAVVHGALPPMRPGAATPPPSPDLIGIDRPLTRADALDAGRELGLDEELLASLGRDRRARA